MIKNKCKNVQIRISGKDKGVQKMAQSHSSWEVKMKHI